MATSATSSRRCAPTTRPKRSRQRRAPDRARRLAALLLAAGALIACGSERAPVQSCTDRLAGVWRLEGGGDRYEAIDAGRTVELHPMFDSAADRPGASAAAFSFVRGAGEIRGSYAFWLTGDDGVRRVRWPAKLVRCARNRLVVAYREQDTNWVQLAFARE